MKTKTTDTSHTSSGHADLVSQPADVSQAHHHRRSIKAEYCQSTDTLEEFSIDDVERSIPERFESIVGKYPDRLAVKMGNYALTYDELNRVSNRIGRGILGNRAERSEPIALLFERGIDVIGAILGTLKTGKFYVALDPTFPAQRNAYMFDDSQAPLIVTNNRNLDLAHQLARNGHSVLNINEIDNGLLSDNLNIFVAPQSPMNIGYTSGSTGTPKGVVKIHRNSAGSAFRMPVRRDDRLSLIHSVSFGSANANLFSSLLNGASLFPFDIKSEGIPRLANWLAEEQITICHLPPAVFRELADFLSNKEMALSLRFIRLSGAPITRRDFELYKKNFSPRTLLSINMSSTEAGGSFSATVDHTFDFPQEGTPLGYPVPGKKVLLLDDDGREVKANHVGEIAIKGRIHAGYWRKPDLTGAKFLADPSGGDERVYLTGDLGRMLPNGFLIHLGRKDFMVKIRGYRIEPSEIESTLSAHPGIRQAGVVAWDREPGEKILVAYVVPRDDAAPTISELHDFLMGKLPDYMMPSSYVFLQSLPLTNGKLDRSLLPLPDNKRPEMGHPYVPPHSDVEQSLIQIWESILNIRPIGIHDDFFELGGHSLLASRLFVEIEKAFGKKLPLTTLFWARNVEQLARIIQHEEWSAPWSLLFPIQASGSKPPFFWVYGETSDVLLPRYLGPDQPLYGLMHEARAGYRVRYTKLSDIAANHLKEIQTVQPQGPYFLGGFCFGGMVAFEMAQQLRRQRQEIALLFVVDLGTLANWRSRFEKTVSFRHEFSDHMRNLAKIGLQEKLKYIHIRVADRIKEIISSGKNISKTIARNAYFATGRPLPPLLRQYYLSSVDHWAMRHYEPAVYPGDLILFKSEQKSYDPAWITRLIGGKFRLREVPCSHSDLLKEPDIAVWARELRIRLQEAQAIQQGLHSVLSPKETTKNHL